MDTIFSDKGRKKRFLINAVCMVLTLLTINLMFFFGAGTARSSALQNDLMLVMTILLSSFCGPLTAVLMELIMFLHTAFIRGNIHGTLGLFVILACALTAYVPVRQGWYKSRIKTLITVPFFCLIINLSYTLIRLAYGLRARLHFDLKAQFTYLLNLLPCIVLVTAVCYAFFNFTPSSIASRFSGYRYFMINRLVRSSRRGRRRISVKDKVTGLIMLEAVILCFSAMVFAYILFNENTDRLTEGSPLSRVVITDSLLQTNFAMLLSLLNFSVPLILFANTFAINRIATPIRLMAEGMNSFSRGLTGKRENGSRPEKTVDIDTLDIKTGDEIEDLYGELTFATAQMEAYIASQEREKQLQEAIQTEMAANQAKTAFLSAMSHEIRTPINAVLGLDEMILRESDEDHIIHYAADIKSAGRSLLSLINDILDFSKIESGRLELINAGYDLGAAINDLVNMISSRAEEKRLAFSVRVTPSTPRVLYGDEVRLKQCVLNLLTNAVKYTREGSVTLEIDWEEASAADMHGNGSAALGGAQAASDRFIMLTVRVSDTGIGIKEEDIPKIFTAFQRIEEKRNRSIEGTGLGMNIVQNLLAMMGTQLDVQSVYGKGSVFAFKVIQRVISDEGVGDFTEIYRQNEAGASNYRASFTAPDAQILCVDDTEMNLTVFTGLLKETQVQIDTAPGGMEALKLCTEKHYDLIFIDHMMPVMDGIETLHALEQLEANKNRGVPVIALTANAVSGAREQYIKAGFSDYLTKPVNSGKLEKMIAHYLPPEKVHQAPAAGLPRQAAEAPRLSARLSDPVLQRLSLISGLDIMRSLEACGSPDVCKDVLKQYAESGPDTLDTIAHCMKKQDWKNYTVKVHSLKSSSRLAGLDALSEAAARLEKSGNKLLDSQPGSPRYGEALAEIQTGTPGLLDACHALILALTEAL